MRTHGSKFGVKTRPQHRQKLENILGKLGFFFSQTPIFLTQNLIFFNGFPISEKSEKIFFNGFLLSLMAIRFLQWLSDFSQWLSTFREIRENLSMAASIQKIAIRALYFSQNCNILR
jgi:hypothetical protein